MKFRSLLLLFGLALIGCQVQDGPPAPTAESKSDDTASPSPQKPTQKKSVAFVTNQIADFWKIAEAGCIAASKEFDIEVQVIMPPEASAVVQKQKVEDVIATGIQGIAISPLDADNQIEWLNSIAEKMPMITHDSDSPASTRRV